MNRRVYLAAVGTAVSAGLAGCSAVRSAFDDESSSGDEYTIGMSRNAFTPAEYEASVGETVVWKNTSSADHTVTALETAIPEDAAYFATGGYEDESTARDAWDEHNGGGIGPRDTFEHTFEVPGTYDYICIPHVRADMIGSVVVSE